MSGIALVCKYARISCSVPFCRRTRANPDRVAREWICGDHWRMVPKERRQVWGRLRRQWRRFGPDKCSPERWFRIWDRLKRQAIESAMGIS